MEYFEYMQSPAWRRRRKEILRAGTFKKCHSCLRSGGGRQPGSVGLELHHKSYDNLGRETFSDVVPLCRECHARIHEMADGCEPVRLSRALAELRAHYRENPVAYTLIRAEAPAVTGPRV